MTRRLLLIITILLQNLFSFGQFEVSGRVFNKKTKEPIGGVIISSHGSTTLSNNDGSFRLFAKDSMIILNSPLAFKRKAIKVKGQTQIEVGLDEEPYFSSNKVLKKTKNKYGTTKEYTLDTILLSTLGEVKYCQWTVKEFTIYFPLDSLKDYLKEQLLYQLNEKTKVTIRQELELINSADKSYILSKAFQEEFNVNPSFSDFAIEMLESNSVEIKNNQRIITYLIRKEIMWVGPKNWNSCWGGVVYEVPGTEIILFSHRYIIC